MSFLGDFAESFGDFLGLDSVDTLVWDNQPGSVFYTEDESSDDCRFTPVND